MDINEPKKSQAGSKVRTFFRVIVISLLMLLIGLIVGFVISDKVAIDIKINNNKETSLNESSNTTEKENTDNEKTTDKKELDNTTNKNTNNTTNTDITDNNTTIAKPSTPTSSSSNDLFSIDLLAKNWESEEGTEIQLTKNYTFIMDHYTISSEVKGTFKLTDNYIDLTTKEGKTIKGIFLISNGEYVLSLKIDGKDINFYDMTQHKSTKVN